MEYFENFILLIILYLNLFKSYIIAGINTNKNNICLIYEIYQGFEKKVLRQRFFVIIILSSVKNQLKSLPFLSKDNFLHIYLK